MSIDALRGGKNPSRQKTNTRFQKEKKQFSFSPKRFFQKKNALFFSIPFFLATVAVSFFFWQETIKGATYGWTQSSWLGGATANKADHVSNQTNWNQYASKDANVQVDANGVSISGTSNSWVTTSDADFNEFSKPYASVSGGAIGAAKPAGGSCTVPEQCRTYACVSGVCTDGCGVISDAQGNLYGTVIIGTQCWMAQNMRYLPAVSSSTVGSDQNNALYYYVYGYTGTDVAAAKAYTISGQNIWSTEGVLYNWAAAMAGATAEKSKGICPTGWHIPSDTEQDTLDQYLKDSGQTCSASRSGTYECATAGTKLKSGGTSGFNASLSGYRNTDGTFNNRSSNTDFWSSSSSGVSAWNRYLSSGSSGVYRYLSSLAYGFSVRCLKDL